MLTTFVKSTRMQRFSKHLNSIMLVPKCPSFSHFPVFFAKLGPSSIRVRATLRQMYLSTLKSFTGYIQRKPFPKGSTFLVGSLTATPGLELHPGTTFVDLTFPARGFLGSVSLARFKKFNLFMPEDLEKLHLQIRTSKLIINSQNI